MQRYLFNDQKVTPDGQPLTRRFSDILVLGSTSLVPNWTFDAQAQYNPDTQQIVRSIAAFAIRRAVPHREHELPADARPVGAGGGRLAVAGLRPAPGGEGGDRSAGGAAAAARSTASAGSTTAPATAA
jgi:hypothetical protein